MKRKASYYKYPNIVIEMARNGDTQESLGKAIGIARFTVASRLSGKSKWRIGEIEAVCKYYNKSYYELFKEGE